MQKRSQIRFDYFELSWHHRNVLREIVDYVPGRLNLIARPRRGFEAWIAGREAADASQPNRGDDEADQPSDWDARRLAWRVAKMVGLPSTPA